MFELPIPKLDAPLILVHGLCGFDRLYAFRRPVIDYFPGAISRATGGEREHGVQSTLEPDRGDPETRLGTETVHRGEGPLGPVHVVGHSLGGLDARYAIAKLGMEERVLSLTTIGTPHRGTSFADWAVRRFSHVAVPILRLLKLPFQAFFDLMTDSCRQFNEDVPNVPGVCAVLRWPDAANRRGWGRNGVSRGRWSMSRARMTGWYRSRVLPGANRSMCGPETT